MNDVAGRVPVEIDRRGGRERTCRSETISTGGPRHHPSSNAGALEAETRARATVGSTRRTRGGKRGKAQGASGASRADRRKARDTPGASKPQTRTRRTDVGAIATSPRCRPQRVSRKIRPDRREGHRSPVAPESPRGRDRRERGRRGGEPGPPEENKGGEAGPRPQDGATVAAEPDDSPRHGGTEEGENQAAAKVLKIRAQSTRQPSPEEWRGRFRKPPPDDGDPATRSPQRTFKGHR